MLAIRWSLFHSGPGPVRPIPGDEGEPCREGHRALERGARARRARGSSTPSRTPRTSASTTTSPSRPLILISELVADAVDHGSDEATIRLSIDDDSVCIELFDAPRRSIVAMTGREEGVPTFRQSMFRRLSDGWSSEEIGDGHLACCEIRR